MNVCNIKKLSMWGVRIVLVLIILFWMSTIFGFSAETGTQSQGLSDKITIRAVQIIEPEYSSLDLASKEELFNKVSFFVRKTGHFSEYGILAGLILILLFTFEEVRNTRKHIIMGAVVTDLICMIYASTDEFHQTFVDGRSGKSADVLIDTSGTVFATIILCLIIVCAGNRRRKNEHPPSPLVTEMIEKMDTERFRLYPDPEASLLVNELAEYYNVKPEQVFVGVGSDDVLGMAFLTCFNSEKPILFPDITYSFYDVWAELFKIPYKTVALDEQFKINPLDFNKENGGIIFPNPNAPTAIEMPLEQVEEVIKNNPDVVVIVDEAYVDFGGHTALSLIDKYDNLLVVRTFSKSRAMAGMRIGYAFGSKELIDAIKAVKFSYNSYTMNQATIETGVAAIKDDTYFKNTVSKIIETRENAKKELKKLGFSFTYSKTNFIFATHKRMPAKEIFEKLKKKNIFVRYFNKPGIDNYLRITVGTDEEMKKLYKALQEILQK